jgi:ketosteroid isomerase-like protein
VGSENVEIVRRLYDCFARRDNETPFQYFSEEIVWDARGIPVFDLDKVFHGHDGVREFWRTWLAAWEEINFEVKEMHEMDDQVVAFVQQRQRGRDTGIWSDMPPYAQAWTVREGKIVRLKYFGAEDARREFGL